MQLFDCINIMPSSSAQFTAQMCPCPTPGFFFFFLYVCVCVQVHFIRRVLGRLPCSLLHLLWKYFIGDVFGRPPAPRSGLAWLIIKCLSCQALRQHPNLFWQPVLHIHSQTSSTHTRVNARRHPHITHFQQTFATICAHRSSRQSINHGVYWGRG